MKLIRGIRAARRQDEFEVRALGGGRPRSRSWKATLPSGAQRWAVDEVGPAYPGVPQAIRVVPEGSAALKAYVASVECSPGGGFEPALCGAGGPMAPQGAGPGPICIECGGSGGSWRKIMLSKLDVTDPEHVVFECAHVLSEIIGSGCNESNIFSNLRMALSEDESRLFIANPDQDTVAVLDIATNTLLAAIPVGAGKRPVDVVVAKKGSPSGPERVYVANQVGQSVTVIDLSGATLQVVGDVSLPGGQTPVALAALSNGTRLFTMNEENGTISVIDLTDPPGRTFLARST